MAPKTAALAGAACLSIGWLAASLLWPPVARLQTRPEPRPARAAASSTATDAFTETLRLKLERSTSLPISRRNPFVFGTRERGRGAETDATSGAASVDEPAPAPMAPAVVAPPFVLAGIAATAAADGEVRTAVLSDGKTVHLVKSGDRVGGYVVGVVSPDAVTLTDASGSQFVIRLR